MADKITKKMGILEVVQKYPAAAPVFGEFGMGCIGCAAAHFENIEEGAKAHGFDDKRIDSMIKKLNEMAAKK